MSRLMDVALLIQVHGEQHGPKGMKTTYELHRNKLLIVSFACCPQPLAKGGKSHVHVHTHVCVSRVYM